jgi:general L-amino acid transport system ATP-binding protein
MVYCAHRAGTVSDPAPSPASQISALEKFYGGFQALKQINLQVHRGEKIAVYGPSGSGKSTLIRCINRLEPHDDGRLVVNSIGKSWRSWLATA